MKHKVASDYEARIHIEGAGEVERRLQITPAIAGWSYLSFRTYTFRSGTVINGESADDEMVMVLLSGSVSMESAGKEWLLAGQSCVFDGRPYTIYLPPGCDYRMTVHTDSDCAYGRAPAEGKFPPRMIPPEALKPELQGGHNFTCQVRQILGPGDAEKLLCSELCIPSGNWGDYPPYRHLAPPGSATPEVDAVHYYRIAPTNGWALQRLYDDDGDLDEVLVVRNGDAVMVRQSYHPVVAAAGCDVYRLGFTASLRSSVETHHDPVLASVRHSCTCRVEPSKRPVS